MNKNVDEKMDRLILENMSLVPYIIKKYYPTYQYDEDIRQIGYVGLVKAARRYDQNSGYSFSTYAAKSILNEIRMTFRRELRSAGAISLESEIFPWGDDKTVLDILKGGEIDYVDLDGFLRKLTPTETIIVQMAISGSNKSEIAKKLNVSKTNIYNIVKNLRKKWPD